MALKQMEPTKETVGGYNFISNLLLLLRQRTLPGSWHPCWLPFWEH
jgi:hypothetical protein